jgi:hypothetical protein
MAARPRDRLGRFIPAGKKSGVYVYTNAGLPALVRTEGRKRLENCGELIVGYIREQMDSPKTGRTYRIPGTGETYVASRPGEYPAVATGNLFLSMSTALNGADQLEIGAAAPYSVFLEGTPQKPGIRPFLSRGIAESMPLVVAEFSRPWDLKQ